MSAKNRKNRENNKREQARPKKIRHLQEIAVDCTPDLLPLLLFSLSHACANAKSPARFPPGLPTTRPDYTFSHKSRNDASEIFSAENFATANFAKRTTPAMAAKVTDRYWEIIVSEQKLNLPGCQFVDAPNNTEFLVLDKVIQDRPFSSKLLDV